MDGGGDDPRLHKVRQCCLSGEAVPIQLASGQIGSVTNIDAEGDTTIYFPDIVLRGENAEVYVLREDLCKLERLVT